MAEWVLLAYSATELAALTAQAVVRERKQDAEILKRCQAELDVYKVTKIKSLVNICMLNARSKTKAQLQARKR